MTFDDVLKHLFHARVGSRELDADVYEHVFGYSVRRQAVSPRARSWVYREGTGWVAMARLTTDTNDALSFAALRVGRVGPLVAEAAAMLAEHRNNAFLRSLPLTITFLVVRAKVGSGALASPLDVDNDNEANCA